jgi:large subunit ribosomal protein L32e
MESIKKLLETRKQIKSKKPGFIRQDAHKKERLKKKWRKPRGLQSKIRLGVAGKARAVSQGYRSPKKVRGLHKSGLQQSLIRTISDLDSLSPKVNCLIISTTLGNKKKIEVMKQAKQKGFEIANIKNPEGYIKKVEDAINLKKKTKEKTKEKEKTAKINKKKTKEETKDGDKKEVEKKEKEKLLTKKEI